MKVEIISVGTELLLGDILNTNAQFISRELATLGIDVFYQTVVGDNHERLLYAYGQAFSRADTVIATGGLGPTEDDLTKETAALFFNRKLELHEESWRRILEQFGAWRIKTPQNNQKQAMMPEGCVVFPNNNGTAPGCAIRENGKTVILLPGPPNELIPMFTESVIPFLRPAADGTLCSRTLKICGVGESQTEMMLKELMDAQTNPTMALYAKTSEVWLRITAKAADGAKAETLIKPLENEVKKILGENIYGTDDDTLPGTVIGLLRKNKLKIALAESCTGGLLTSDMVDVPGVSDVLTEAAVTYSNESKVRRLGVSADTLAKHGAVSVEAAKEMALGVAKASGADVGVSITGIAGPEGGSPDKPVGLVYVGFHVSGKTEARECRFTGERNKIRRRATVAAMDALRRILLDLGK